jgi:hypothetical protein
MSCYKRNQLDYQPFPVSGGLAKNSNLRLKSVQKRLAKEKAMVYCYIIKSVKNKDNIFQQTGCGPNWQGDLITLCTCKHYMRTFKSSKDWEGKWIAGFTTVGDGCNRRNALVYLMKVKDAFESHHDLWYALSPDARIAKDANKEGNIHGDVFRPIRRLKNGDKYNPSEYKGPCDLHDHSKKNGWHKDVKYFYNNRYASLLVGDKKNSFLWDRPLAVAIDNLHRGQKKMSLGELLNSFLCEV